MPRRRRSEDRRSALPALPGQRRHPLAPRQHGVLEELRRVRRLGTPAADGVRALRRARRRDAQRDDHGRDSRGRQRRRPHPRAGEGKCRRAARPAGDLYLAVQVEPHETFVREGDDFHITVPIGVHEAALGAKIDVPAPDGTARLRVPPGTQTGQRFHIRGRGAPSPRNGERGDLVVEVRIVLPKVLDERSKELLREFGRINDEQIRRERGRRARRIHEEDRQGLLHDQRGGAEVQHPPADIAAVRARRAAQAVAHRRQHAAVLGRGSRAARNDSHA